ncbi:SDR family oxidoreductase [Variovorax sp. UC122_21]|uniref:SDR family oxidoreductase n=1 Tax=Variovorax sp. UC122_21 TaxID=3374554 RepID=UPI00375650B6
MSAAPSSTATPPERRTVLVTGAGKRLGREIALALAAGGWRVAVHFRQSRAEAEQTVADCAALAGEAHAFGADLLDEAATRALLPQVAAHFGRVDAVVHSAALFEHDDAASFSYALMDRHARGNTGAAIVLAQALHAHLAQRDPEGTLTGAVVHMLDQKLWNTNPDFLSYTLSKAALEAATPMLALALAPRVRVVGVAPGLTLPSHMHDDDKFAQLHRLSPLGRSSTSADVAATVRFALENGSITGTTLLVDGGQHLMKFERDFSHM